MLKFGRVSGGLYALSGRFVRELKSSCTYIPEGFVGEDFLISAIAKDRDNYSELGIPNTLFLAIEEKSYFKFDQLSLLNPPDYIAYLKRLIRYRLRDYQIVALTYFNRRNPGARLPHSAIELFEKGSYYPRLYWRGRYTAIDWLAVIKIRLSLRNRHNSAR